MDRIQNYALLVSALLFFGLALPVMLTHSTRNSTLPYQDSNRSILDLVPPAGFLNSTWNSNNKENAVHLGHVALNADLWDMSSESIGYVSISAQKSVTTVVNFTNVGYGQEQNQVIGYPNVGYGYSAFGVSSSEWNFPQLELPLKLSALPNIISSVSYQINTANGRTPYDFAYDIWITQSIPGGAINSAPGRGDIELMMWTDYSTDLAPHCVLFICSSRQAGSVQLPTVLNGANSNQSWNIWISNGDQANNRASTVLFILANPQRAGTVGIDLQEVTMAMEKALVTNYPSFWKTSFASYWFDYVSLGSEFRPESSGAAQYSWNITNYCLFVNYPELSTSSSNYSCGTSSYLVSPIADILPSDQSSLYYFITGVGLTIALSLFIAIFVRTRKRTRLLPSTT